MSTREAPSNRSTISAYEECAIGYAGSTAPKQGWDGTPELHRFLAMLPPGSRVLEIGSGPGWDADWLEGRGVSIRRTDATQAFVDFQNARGAHTELLDVVIDDIGGPYTGVIAQYVFQHIERAALPQVFAKIAHALVKGGAFLLILREGQRDIIEERSSGGSYLIVEWEKPDLIAILNGLDLSERWSRSSADEDGDWLAILVEKGGHQ